MSEPRADDRDGPEGGATTAAGGTPVAVDVAPGPARSLAAVLLAGPLIWTAHFFFVYMVAEAGCTGDGPGLSVFDPPVPQVATLGATAVAAVASLACARWAHRRWRAAARNAESSASNGVEDPGREVLVSFAGLLLSLLSFVTILFVGLPALVLSPC